MLHGGNILMKVLTHGGKFTIFHVHLLPTLELYKFG